MDGYLEVPIAAKEELSLVTECERDTLRIVSLLPSSTEIIYALGLDDHLVGVTHECDYPPEVLHKPRVTSSAIVPEFASRRIDGMVREALETSGTLYQLDVGLLHELKPNLILTQQLCTVCAVSFESVSRIAYSLPGNPRVMNLEPTSIEGILETIEEIGRIAGVEERSDRLARRLKDRLADLRNVTSPMTPKRACCLEWLDPPFCAGHWIPELIEIAGGRDPIAQKHLPSKQVAWEEILSYNPEVIVVMCCGFSVERSMQDIEILFAPPLNALQAVQEGEVYVTDGASLFSRPGPRIVESAGVLARIFHPHLFPGHDPAHVATRVGQWSKASISH